MRVLFFILLFFSICSQLFATDRNNPSDTIPARLVNDSAGLTYAGQRKNVLKFDPLIFTSAITSVAFERSLTTGMSLEGGVGFIGIGPNKDYYNEKNIAGNFFRLGLKFYDRANFIRKPSLHRLAGLYLRPELFYMQYKYDVPGTYQIIFPPKVSTGTYHETYEVTGVAFIANVGKQWILSNIVVLDVFVGVGEGKRTLRQTYTTNPPGGAANPKPDKPGTTLFPGFIIQNGNGVQACFQAGFKVGLVFGQ